MFIHYCADYCLESGEVIKCSQVVICTGTFLSGEIHIGQKTFPAGRLGDDPSVGLSASLNKAGFALGRLQTGTPARLDGSTIDFSGMERQDGDADPQPFSFLNRDVENKDKQVACFKTHTTAATHDLVRQSIHLSVHIQETKKGLFSPCCASCRVILTQYRPSLLPIA